MAVPHKDRSKLVSPTFNVLRPLLPAYLGLFGLSFFLPFLYFASPLFVGQVMERVMMSRSEATLFVLASIALFMLCGYAVIEWVRQKALQRLGVVIDGVLSGELFDAMHRPRTSGAVASPSTLQDFNVVRNTLSGPSVTAVFDALWAPIFLLVMVIVHWVFGLLALVLMGLTAGLVALNHRLVREDSQRAQKVEVAALEFGTAVTRNADTVRALGMLPNLRNRWYELHTKALGWQSVASQPTDIISGVIKFTRNAQMVFIYTVGTLLALNQMIAPAGVFIAMMVMMRALGPIDQVISNWTNYSAFQGAVGRIDAILREVESAPAKIALPELSGPLVVSRVYAAAPGGEKAILSDISFAVAQGRSVCVVGPSGAGKSCLGRILVGAWTPRRGSVSVGDHDLSHWNQDELGKRIGYIPQDVELFPGTIAENIARFDPAAEGDPSGVIAAAELAGIQDLIRGLPDGYNTRIGSGGHVLSGGQRQRIGIARAVYGDPALVVLDEPNSNLDASAEQELVGLMKRLQDKGVTVFIITHKLNIMTYCDDVLILNSGSVQAFAPREQIVDRLPRLKAQPTLTVIEGSSDARKSS